MVSYITTVSPYMGNGLHDTLITDQAKGILEHPNVSFSNDSWKSEIVSMDISIQTLVPRLNRDNCIIIPETEIMYRHVLQRHPKNPDKLRQKKSKCIDYIIYDQNDGVKWGVETKRVFVDYADYAKRYWEWDGVMRCIKKAIQGIKEAKQQVYRETDWDKSVLHLLIGDSRIFEMCCTQPDDIKKICKDVCDCVIVSFVLQQKYMFFRSHTVHPECEEL